MELRTYVGKTIYRADLTATPVEQIDATRVRWKLRNDNNTTIASIVATLDEARALGWTVPAQPNPTPEPTPAPAPAPAPAPTPMAIGVNGAASWEASTFKAAGCTIDRCSFVYPSLTPDHGIWPNTVRSRGFEPVVVFDTPNHARLDSISPVAFGSWVANVAMRCAADDPKWNTGLLINEFYFKGGTQATHGDVLSYGRLIAAAYRKIDTDGPWSGRRFLAELYKPAALALVDPILKTRVDGFMSHPYGPPNYNYADIQGQAAMVKAHQAAISAGYANTDVWCDELGFKIHPTETDPVVVRTAQQQADRLAEQLASLKALGWVRAAIVYTAYGKPGTGDAGWAVLDPTTYQPRPAVDAIRKAAA